MSATITSSSPPMTFSADDFRSNFPPLSELVHLASCSQGALSTQVGDALGALTTSLTEFGAPWGVWSEQVELLRGEIAAFINATPDEIALLPSASEGAFQVASSFDWSQGGAILTSALEFPSVGHVLRAQRPGGATLRSIDDRVAALDPSEWEERIGGDTRLVSVPLVSYHDGSRAPVTEIARRAHASGALVLVDAYQGAGVVPIDVRELDCDFLIAGTLKYMLGLAGVAFLYVRGGLVSDRLPELTGWFGRVNPFAFDPDLVDYPASARRFEVGTPAIPAVYAARAGLSLLSAVDQNAGWAHVQHLTTQLAEGLEGRGFRLSRPASPELQGPQVAVRLDDPNAVAETIQRDRVISAPRGELLRLAVHYYTTESDIEAAVKAVASATAG